MACGLAPSAELLIVFRIVQAVGAAALIPSSLALVMHAFAHDQLPRAVAIWGAAGAVAGALGPTLGAAIVEGLGWRWAFFINLPVGIYTVVAGRRNLHESSDPETQVPSLVGVVLIAGAAGLLSYGVVGSEEFGWLSAQTLGVLGAGVAMLAVFVAHQRHTKAPALDLELFRITNFRWANIAMLVFGTAFAALFLGSILFLTQVWGWSVLQAGFGVAPGPIVVGLVAPRAGKLAGRIGQRPLLITGGVLFASSGLYRLVMLGPDVNYLRDYFPSMVLSGLGVAFVFPQLSSAVAQALPPGRAGVGGAALQAVRQFGGTFGVALTIAFLGTAGRRRRRLRPDLVDRRRRRTRHVRARPADAHLHKVLSRQDGLDPAICPGRHRTRPSNYRRTNMKIRTGRSSSCSATSPGSPRTRVTATRPTCVRRPMTSAVHHPMPSWSGWVRCMGRWRQTLQDREERLGRGARQAWEVGDRTSRCTAGSPRVRPLRTVASGLGPMGPPLWLQSRHGTRRPSSTCSGGVQ